VARNGCVPVAGMGCAKVMTSTSCTRSDWGNAGCARSVADANHDRVNALTPVSTNVERYDTLVILGEKEHKPSVPSWQEGEEDPV